MSSKREVKIDENLGVTHSCFGEFTCPTCNRFWESAAAWRYFGQKCLKCAGQVKPVNLQRVYYYKCESCLTSSKGREGFWKYKYTKDGRPCKKCQKIVLPSLTKETGYVLPVLKLTLDTDREKAHQEDLCEMCKLLGTCCRGKIFKEESELEAFRLKKKRGNYTSTSLMKTGKQPLQVNNTSSFTAIYTQGLVSPTLSYRAVASIGVPSADTSATSNKAPTTTITKVRREPSSNQKTLHKTTMVFHEEPFARNINQTRSDSKCSTLRCDPGRNIANSRPTQYRSNENIQHVDNPNGFVLIIFIALLFMAILMAISENKHSQRG